MEWLYVLLFLLAVICEAVAAVGRFVREDGSARFNLVALGLGFFMAVFLIQSIEAV